MRPDTTLALSGMVYEQLRAHLHPGDGKESAAILLCTPVNAGRYKLLVKHIELIPHHLCLRKSDAISWPGQYLESAIDRAESDELSVILIHSHPSGATDFSAEDNDSDQQSIRAVFAATSTASPTLRHGSAIMTPDGVIKARTYNEKIEASPVDLVSISGTDILLFWNDTQPNATRPIAFSTEMRRELGRLSVVVVGASGTGSITAEQLLRIGLGSIYVVEPEKIEHKNLNRILNSTMEDAENGNLKTDVFIRAARLASPTTAVETVTAPIRSRRAIRLAAKADFIFCCVDSDEGRAICDLIASAMLMPLFDVGVVIPTRTSGINKDRAIADINGRIDYVQPNRSNLGSRGVYTPQSLHAEYLAKNAPQTYDKEVKEGYMPGTVEQAPSVITLNMRAASACVQELIARVYPYRHDGNEPFARTIFSLAACEEEFFPETAFTSSSTLQTAAGLAEPLLGLPNIEE